MKIVYELPEAPDILLPEAKKLAAQHGGKIEGDSNSGTFTGKGVSGSYTISGNKITVLIGKVPPFVTEKRIMEEVGTYFAIRHKNT